MHFSEKKYFDVMPRINYEIAKGKRGFIKGAMIISQDIFHEDSPSGLCRDTAAFVCLRKKRNHRTF
jgi:hypothetical protein